MRNRFAIRLYRRSLAWACPVQPTSDMPLVGGIKPSFDGVSRLRAKRTTPVGDWQLLGDRRLWTRGQAIEWSRTT
jgi:hypothetical protein